MILGHPGSSVGKAGTLCTEAVSSLQQPRVRFHLVAVAQEVERVVYQSNGWLFGLHVEASLGNILNCKLLPRAVPSLCECVCMSSDEQVGTSYVSCLVVMFTH